MTGGPYRQSEDAVIQSTQDGTFTLNSWERDHDWEQVGATWIDADNVAGETARIAFVQGNPLLPVFFSRGSKPNNRIVPDETILEWGTIWGRLAGQNSAVAQSRVSPITVGDGDSFTDVHSSEPTQLRSSRDYLYWATEQSGDLYIYRADTGGSVTSTVYLSTGLGGLFTMLSDGLFLVSTGDKSLALLRFGNATPLWANTYSFDGEFWADGFELTDGTEGRVVIAPIRHGGATGFLTLLRVDGSLVSNTTFSFETETDQPGIDDSKINPESPEFIKLESALVMNSVAWDTEAIGNNLCRGLFLSGTVLIPAMVYSNQVVGLSSDGAITWSHTGWGDLDQAGTSEGEITTYERYTVVAADESRVVLFVGKFGYEKVAPARERAIVYDEEARYYMHQDDIDDVEATSGTYVAEESFGESSGWVFYDDGAGDDTPADFVTDYVADLHDAFDNGTTFAADPDDELVMCRLEYGYRVLDSQTGSVVSNWWLRDMDGASLDGSRGGSTDAEKVEIQTGLPQVNKVTKTYTKSAWDGGASRTGEAWYPANFSVSPTLLAESGIDWEALGSKVEAVFHYQGEAHVPYGISTANRSPDYDSGTDGSLHHVTPWSSSLNRNQYTSDFVTNRNLLSGIVEDEDPQELDGRDTHPFRLAADVESPTDLIDLHWLTEYTTVDVYIAGYDYATQEVDLIVDAAPRWDAVNGVLVDGKLVFPPGYRNAGSPPDDGGIVVLID